MTRLVDIAAEIAFFDKVADELASARFVQHHEGIAEAVEDLELVVMHTTVLGLRDRARRLIDTAFDPVS